MVGFGQKFSYSAKSGCIRGKWLYSNISDCILQSGCIRAKGVIFGQKWMYSGNSGCILAKVVVFLNTGCIQKR